MSTRLVTLRPESSVRDAVRVLLRNSISGVPVVDEKGELLGVYSEFDCLKHLANDEFHESHEEEATVRDHMTRHGHTIQPDLGLYSIAQTFVSLRVRRLPVVEGGKLLGQVSRRDVLRALDELGSKLHDQRRYPDYPEDREPLR